MRKTNNQSGMVLLMALIFVALMILFAGMLIEPVRCEAVAAARARSAVVAFYAAEAGIEMAVADLLRSDDLPKKRNLKLGSLDVSYEIAALSKTGRCLVVARGTAPGSLKRPVTRVVAAEVAIHQDKGVKRAEVVWEHVRK